MRNESTLQSASAGDCAGAQLQLTPRTNENLNQRLGGFSTLVEGLEYAARGVTGFNFYSPRGRLERVQSYRELRDRAIVTGRRLISTGLKRGDRVGIVAETGPEFMAVFFGCQYAGLVPCPMPYAIHIGGRDAYVERIAGMLMSAHASAVVAPEDLKGSASEAAGKAGVEIVLSHCELDRLAQSDGALEPFGADEVAYIQYSSGSTSRPKGVLISQAAICANTTGILRHGLKVGPTDRAFSWLPLYHDMGLVGFCLSPLMGQVTTDYLATPAFARRPVLWLQIMAQNRSSICYSPSFGYDLAARRVNGDAAKLDLSAWRIAGIGGDMVRCDVLELFSQNLAIAGFDPRAFLPSYGMAESTLGITFVDTENHFRVDVVDRDQVKMARHAVPAPASMRNDVHRTRSFVVCGSPLPGHEVKVCDDLGRSLSDRQIGHVVVRGPSLMAGYFENEPATSAVMRSDGYMDTGDMGYLLGGEVVITGRAKDLILHNGRNIWPQDIEWAVEQVQPLRSGDVAAFAVEGRDDEDNVVVLVQCRVKDEERIELLRREACAAVHRSAGIECDVVLVAPKSLPFTSSGKLSRVGAKARYVSGEMDEITTGLSISSIDDEMLKVAAAG